MSTYSSSRTYLWLTPRWSRWSSTHCRFIGHRLDGPPWTTVGRNGVLLITAGNLIAGPGTGYEDTSCLPTVDLVPRNVIPGSTRTVRCPRTRSIHLPMAPSRGMSSQAGIRQNRLDNTARQASIGYTLSRRGRKFKRARGQRQLSWGYRNLAVGYHLSLAGGLAPV